MRPLPDSSVFDRADLRGLGWSDAAITRATRSRRLVRLRHGQLTAYPEPDAALAAIAAVRACRGSVISHRSALAMYGLPIVGARPARPELPVAPRGIGSMHVAHLHRATLGPRHVGMVDGEPITSVARTLVDVARSRPVSTSVPVIDAALHARLVSEDDIVEVLISCWSWPGIRRAQRAFALADGCAESPLEAVSRLVNRWLRLPPALPQRVVRDEHGRILGRLDFYSDEFGVAGEADGRSKYGERDVLTAEKDRQEELEDVGIVFARWGWDFAVRRPHALRDKITRAFERGRQRDRSGLRRRWSVSDT